jgi:hypothetical protein
MKQLRRRETGAAEAAQLAEIATGRPAGAGTLVAEARAHHIEARHREDPEADARRRAEARSPR